MSDYFERQEQYRRRHAEITADAYNDLIELVFRHGNRRLKDQMSALMQRTAAATTAAYEESRPSASREGATR